MFLVHLQLPLNDLAAHMCDMRIWLDRHNIETSGFSYKALAVRWSALSSGRNDMPRHSLPGLPIAEFR
jgi:hypothetical protein